MLPVKRILLDPRIAIGAAGSAALMALAVWIVLKRRLTPEEKERRRRFALNQHRRTVEGFLTEGGEGALYYQYELAGVEYSTSQDVSLLAAMLPPDPTRLVGPVNVKYDPRNPANSIIICEEWSGLPAPLSRSEDSSGRSPDRCHPSHHRVRSLRSRRRLGGRRALARHLGR